MSKIILTTIVVSTQAGVTVFDYSIQSIQSVLFQAARPTKTTHIRQTGTDRRTH